MCLLQKGVLVRNWLDKPRSMDEIVWKNVHL